jgi:hypothetical protein
MWHGDKSMPDPVVSSADHGRSRALALALISVSAMAVFGIVSMGS